MNIENEFLKTIIFKSEMPVFCLSGSKTEWIILSLIVTQHPL